MTSLTERLRQHAQLHQQCTVQDDEQKTFADDLIAAAAEIERAMHHAREIGPLMQRASDVAGERAANAVLTAENAALTEQVRVLTEALQEVYQLVGQGGSAYDINLRTRPVISAALEATK
jgi:hypothetical protein